MAHPLGLPAAHGHSAPDRHNHGHGILIRPGRRQAAQDLPQWARQVERYNAITVDGRRRKFPERLLAGAEAILARLWHEHHKTKLYSPTALGEILSKRTFTATGEVNPLALPRKPTGTGQTLKIVGNELVATDDPPSGRGSSPRLPTRRPPTTWPSGGPPRPDPGRTSSRSSAPTGRRPAGAWP